MKKKLLFLTLCLFLISGCTKTPALKNGEEEVATTSIEKISNDDLYEQVKLKYSLSELLDMVDNKILRKEYKKEISNAEKEADTQIKSLISYFGDEDKFIEALKSQTGYSTKDDYKNYLVLSNLKSLAVTDYAKTKVTNKMINAYYKSDIVGDIKCSHILITADIKDDMTDDEQTKAKEKALEEAKDLIKQIKNSKDVATTFANLAKEYSDDDSTKKKGGDLGYFNKGEMETAFENAAYALTDGKYTTTPIETSYGYHIILRVATKDKAALKDVKDSVIESVAKNLITDNPVYNVDAMTTLRDKYKFEIDDSELKTQYANYIQNQVASYTQSTDDESSSN